MEYGLASSVSDQAAGEVSLPIRFRQKGAWITLGLEAVFSRNMRRNTCFLIGGLISFDYSLQGGRRTSYPKLIWGMSVIINCGDGELLIVADRIPNREIVVYVLSLDGRRIS